MAHIAQPATFYAALRKGPLFASLTQSQVDGIEATLAAFDSYGDGQVKSLAYALATSYHETGTRMVPVRETFAADDAEARRRLGHRRYARSDGPYGHAYYGRGIVQLTWLQNYARSSTDAGIDLVKHPDAMLQPDISAKILIKGLLDGRWNAQGLGIAHYLPADGEDDLKGARRTVNLTDRWSDVARYYREFLRAIEAAGGLKRRRAMPSWLAAIIAAFAK